MKIIRRIIAWIETKIEGRKYHDQKDATRAMIIANMAKYAAPVTTPAPPHPGYEKHIQQCREKFSEYYQTKMKTDSDRTVAFADSILAQARDRIGYAMDPLRNYALGGMGAEHMLQCINDMALLFAAVGFSPRNIVIGSFGNNLLAYCQAVPYACAQGKAVLDRIRVLWPEAKVIVYGLPMTIVPAVIQAVTALDGMDGTWITLDHNSVGIPLIKHFVENWHILPKADMSSDGVHLTPAGQILLGDLIVKAKKSPPKRLINNG